MSDNQPASLASSSSSASSASQPSLPDQIEQGRRQRGGTPRSALAKLGTAPRDPLGIIDKQNLTRLPALIPLRRERMSASPFTFYRGTAALMAADLADAPHSGILVASCGDAHVSNFGFYASPQRRLVFDLNDFDEAAWAPWEWDVKRLAASIVIAGQATGRDDTVVRKAARAAVRTYAQILAAAVATSPTDRYFAHSDVAADAETLDPRARTWIVSL